MKLFHATEAYEQIERDGFRDGTGKYLTDFEFTGVWVSAEPLDDHPSPEARHFEIEVGDLNLEPFEWVEEGKPYREFLVPAEVLNQFPRRLL